MISCNGLNKDSINVILEEKKNVIRGSGSLTYVYPEPASNLGGYKSLRGDLRGTGATINDGRTILQILHPTSTT